MNILCAILSETPQDEINPALGQGSRLDDLTKSCTALFSMILLLLRIAAYSVPNLPQQHSGGILIFLS